MMFVAATMGWGGGELLDFTYSIVDAEKTSQFLNCHHKWRTQVVQIGHTLHDLKDHTPHCGLSCKFQIKISFNVTR